jgi:hypothetical protein
MIIGVYLNVEIHLPIFPNRVPMLSNLIYSPFFLSFTCDVEKKVCEEIKGLTQKKITFLIFWMSDTKEDAIVNKNHLVLLYMESVVEPIQFHHISDLLKQSILTRLLLVVT